MKVRVLLPILLLAMLALLASIALLTAPRSSPPANAAPVLPPIIPTTATPPLPTAITHTLSLPAITVSDPFTSNPPIWSHTAPPAPHEVSLFRHTVRLDTPSPRTDLAIFADTRYEVWVDGAWVGRGPARFSRQTRAYDTYSLGRLAPGPHLIAVLVQWAPNIRRSESTRPMLRAHITTTTPDGRRGTIRTGPRWKAMRTPAWREDAALVHAWQLLGPTELLDLRELPANWMEPGYSDAAWPRAEIVPAGTATYQPRSIALPQQVPMAPRLHDAGLLSPDNVLGELPRIITGTHTITVTARATTPLTVATLAWPGKSEPATMAQLWAKRPAPLPLANVEMQAEQETQPGLRMALDGQPVTLTRRAGHPPDVLAAQPRLAKGKHTLTISSTQASHWPLQIAQHNIVPMDLPFAQGTHAGRRLLLANPTSAPDAVQHTPGPYLNLDVTRAPAYVVLDLGRVVHGRLVAQVAGPSGTVVDIGWDERLWRKRRPLPYPGSYHPQWNQTDSWVLDGTPRTISTIDTRTGRYILIAVWGQQPVSFEALRVYEERYPLVQQGDFVASNPRLNTIWQIGVDTLYPTMADSYADPWRERGQWWGDAFVANHVNRAAFGDTRLVARGLRLMAEAFHDGRPPALAPNPGQARLLDYGMLWVHSVYDYWQVTGDQQAVARCYPALRDFLDYLASYEHDTTGLLDIPSGPWSTTALIDWAAPDSNRVGQSMPLNALYASTLDKAATLATVADDRSRSGQWRQKATHVRRQAHALLYDPQQGAYYATLIEGQRHPPSPQAQAWALTYRIVPDAEEQRVANALVSLLSDNPQAPNVETYGMYWVLEALARAHRFNEALSIIEQYYGHMVERGATTWWESFNADRSYTQSLSHAWSGAPTWFLTTYILGARQTGPQQWQVQPAFSDAGNVAGALPLPQGRLAVGWAYLHTSERTLRIEAPEGTTGQIILPVAYADEVTLLLNGQTAWRGGEALLDYVTARTDADSLYISVTR